MLVALDVDYRSELTKAAFVAFVQWSDERPADEGTMVFPACTDPYQAGEFFRRELTYLLAVLAEPRAMPDVVVIDGYVWLGDQRPGLGVHLHKRLGGVPVIGIAKRPFRGNANAIEILRGRSARPIFVTAVGLPLADAAESVASMAGEHRIPALLKRGDRLARA